jgi:uncharacterized membrane protein YhhN
MLAIVLYSRNRRAAATSADKLIAGVLVAVAVTDAFVLPTDRSGAAAGAIYAAALGAMAATAWLSRFPRGRVALGASMFLVSDMLIFARAGPLAGQRPAVVGFLVWGLYFAGQALICLGVTRMLAAPVRAWRG